MKALGLLHPSSSRHPLLTNEDSTEGHAPSKYKIIQEYEMKLRQMKGIALIVAGLQQIPRFLGICALTWATVVLLGGFASNLRTIDFYFVSILLLVEAARLSTTLFFSKLVTKKLFEEEQDPEKLLYTDKQPILATMIDMFAQVAHLLFALSSLILPTVRLILGKLGGQKNLRPALFIFYILVLLNSVTAILCVLCRLVVRLLEDDLSLRSYHDEVFRRALDIGLVEADDFNFFSFTFRKLGQDYLRNLQPLAVMKANKKLIKYLYAHPKGVEIVCQYLRSDDTFEQQAAANMVGFWAREDRIDQQTVLLSMLAEKLGSPGKTAEAAANSFKGLAKEWVKRDPHPLLSIYTNRSGRIGNVVDLTVDLLLQRINPTLLTYLRALDSFFQSEKIVEYVVGGDATRLQELTEKLRGIICPRENHSNRRGPRARTKIYAAVSLKKLVGELTKQDREHIGKIDPSSEPHVWRDEKTAFDRLLRELDLGECTWPAKVRDASEAEPMGEEESYGCFSFSISMGRNAAPAVPRGVQATEARTAPSNITNL